MSSNVGDSKFALPKPPRPESGVKTVLQYTGIPPSWLDKRPSLPSRNWLIFLGVTSTIAGFYIYDRRKCKHVRQEYVDRVKHLAEVPLHSLDYPRKVTVYGCKWPGDEEYDRSMKYFRKYVKPILVAAAVDYEMINGRRHGDLARRIADEIRSQRRISLGLEKPPALPMLPGSTPEEKQRRKLQGGVIVVGRHTFKEYMAGLKQGWTDNLEVSDREEELAKVLELDGRFDEPEPEFAADGVNGDDEPIPTSSKLPPSNAFSAFTSPHLRAPPPLPKSLPADAFPSSVNTPPAEIPPQPPMLLVHFVNHIGFTQIPLMIWDFFSERTKVRLGAEAAYKLIMGETRPFSAPETVSSDVMTDFDVNTPQKPHVSELSPTDLDFDREAESYYKKSLVRSFSSDIEKAREEYYKSLPAKLDTARALARGTREPTKEERNYPPPTEVELRAERMKKELRWRSDEKGWEIVKPEKDVEWDERLRSVLQVYVDPLSSSDGAVDDVKS